MCTSCDSSHKDYEKWKGGKKTTDVFWTKMLRKKQKKTKKKTAINKNQDKTKQLKKTELLLSELA